MSRPGPVAAAACEASSRAGARRPRCACHRPWPGSTTHPGLHRAHWRFRDGDHGCAQCGRDSTAVHLAVAADAHRTVVRVYRSCASDSCRCRAPPPPIMNWRSPSRCTMRSVSRWWHSICGRRTRWAGRPEHRDRAGLRYVDERSAVVADVPGNGLRRVRLTRAGRDTPVLEQPDHPRVLRHRHLGRCAARGHRVTCRDQRARAGSGRWWCSHLSPLRS